MARLALVMSLVRCDRRDEALVRAKEFLNDIPDMPDLMAMAATPMQAQLMADSLERRLRNIIAALESPEIPPVDDFDPFGL